MGQSQFFEETSAVPATTGSDRGETEHSDTADRYTGIACRFTKSHSITTSPPQRRTPEYQYLQSYFLKSQGTHQHTRHVKTAPIHSPQCSLRDFKVRQRHTSNNRPPIPDQSQIRAAQTQKKQQQAPFVLPDVGMDCISVTRRKLQNTLKWWIPRPRIYRPRSPNIRSPYSFSAFFRIQISHAVFIKFASSFAIDGWRPRFVYLALLFSQSG
jgi:hypothetical protein